MNITCKSESLYFFLFINLFSKQVRVSCDIRHICLDCVQLLGKVNVNKMIEHSYFLKHDIFIEFVLFRLM